MNQLDPVLIVGGGLTGVTTFYELVARNVPAVLLESQADVAHGTSYANGGVLHPSLPDPWNNPRIGPDLLRSVFNPRAAMKLHLSQLPSLFGWGFDFLRNSVRSRHLAITEANFELAHYSTRQTDALRQFLGLQYDAAAPGTLKIFRTPADRDAALQLAERLAALGLVYRELDRPALQKLEPALAKADDRIIGALHFPDDRVGDARLFCRQLAAQAVAKGGELRCGQTVESLRVEHGRVVGVRLGDEELRGRVVICAGVAARQLVAPLGVKLPIRPAKGYSMTLDASQLTGTQLTHPIVDAGLHIAVTPLADKLRVLGMAEFIGMDTNIDPMRITLLRQFFEQLLPDIAAQLNWEEAENWSGLRPMSSDGRPFIGAAGVEGLWLNCGHGHLGWTKAVGSARVVSDQMIGRRPEINAAPFSFSADQRSGIFN